MFPVSERYRAAVQSSTQWRVFGWPVHDDRDTRWPDLTQAPVSILDGEYEGDAGRAVRWSGTVAIPRYLPDGYDLKDATHANSGAFWRTVMRLRYIDGTTEDIRMPLCMVTTQNVNAKTLELDLQSMERIYQDFSRPTLNATISAANLYGVADFVLGGRVICPAFRPTIDGVIIPGAGSGGTDIGSPTVQFSSSNGDILEALDKVITSYAREWYIDRDARLQIRAVPTIADTAVWTIANGANGTLMEPIPEDNSRDDLYNEVYAYNPSSGNIWAVARDDNPSHPTMYSTANGDDYRHGFGIRTFTYSSTYFTNSSQALSTAQLLLAKLLGRQQSLEIEAYPNPALDPGDVGIAANEPVFPARPVVIKRVRHPLKVATGAPKMQITTEATEVPTSDTDAG